MNALPSPKRNRRNGPTLRFASLVAAVSALGLAFWLILPAQFVWWTSPPIGRTGLQLHALVPRGWDEDTRFRYMDPGNPSGVAHFELALKDRRPWLLRLL